MGESQQGSFVQERLILSAHQPVSSKFEKQSEKEKKSVERKEKKDKKVLTSNSLAKGEDETK